MIIVDATDLILGRLASFAAKKALQGETIEIINAEKAIISGNRTTTFAKYERKRMMGTPHHGPYQPRRTDQIVKRTIRGMLPYKKERGREAFKKIKIHIGIPEQLKNKPSQTIKQSNAQKLPTIKYITIEELSKHLGA